MRGKGSFYRIYYILHFVFIFLIFQTMSKKDRKMKSSGSLEEFQAEYNIPLSIGLHFVEDGEVDLAKGSFIEGEIILPKS